MHRQYGVERGQRRLVVVVTAGRRVCPTVVARVVARGWVGRRVAGESVVVGRPVAGLALTAATRRHAASAATMAAVRARVRIVLWCGLAQPFGTASFCLAKERPTCCHLGHGSCALHSEPGRRRAMRPSGCKLPRGTLEATRNVARGGSACRHVSPDGWNDAADRAGVGGAGRSRRQKRVLSAALARRRREGEPSNCIGTLCASIRSNR